MATKKTTSKKNKDALKPNANTAAMALNLGAFFEESVQYRGYYIEQRKTQWAGPWRNDQMAAAADVFPYVQQGYQTGIRMKQL